MMSSQNQKRLKAFEALSRRFAFDYSVIATATKACVRNNRKQVGLR